MRIYKTLRFISTLANCFFLSVLIPAAHGDEAESPKDNEPQLQPVFRDDFTTDTRGDYEIKGEVSREAGKLTMAEGASITREINGGAWAEVRLAFAEDGGTPGADNAEVRIWFQLKGATNCFVRLFRFNDSATDNNVDVSIVDTGRENGKEVEQTVRKTAVKLSQPVSLTVTYRYGLIEVTDGDHSLLTGFVNNGAATVAAINVQSAKAESCLNQVEMFTTSNAQQFSPEQQDALAKAEKLNDHLIQLLNQGKNQEAAEVGKQVLQVRREILGTYHADYTTSLNNLALAFQRMGEFAKAKPLYEECAEVDARLLGTNNPSFATTLNNLAGLCQNMGDGLRAKALYEQSLQIRKSVLGAQHPDYGNSLNNMAFLLDEIGQFAEAVEHYQQCLQVLKATVGEDHPHYATTLSNLGGLHNRLGDFAQAEPLCRRAVEIQKKLHGENHPLYANSLNNLALIHKTTGDLEQAALLYRKASDIAAESLGTEHPFFAICLNNMAAVYEHQKDYARAKTAFEEANRIVRNRVGENHPAYATGLSNLASTYAGLGDSLKAESTYQRALEINSGIFGNEHPNCAYNMTGLAKQHLLAQRFTEAISLLQQANSIWRESFGKWHPNYADGLNHLAVAYNSQGDFEQGALLIREAVAVKRKILDENSVVQSARQQAENQASQRHIFDNRLASALRLDLTDETLEDLWKWKGAVTLRQRAYRQAATDRDVAQLFADLRLVSRQLSALTSQAPVRTPEAASSQDSLAAFQKKREAWKIQFASLTQKRESLERQIAAQNADFARVKQHLTVAMARQHLGPKTAFIDFIEYRDSVPEPPDHTKPLKDVRFYLAFVLRPDTAPVMLRIGPAAVISDAVAEFRRQFSSAGLSAAEQRQALKAATTLRESLWQPIEQHLTGIESVIISPDTMLGTLPFAALPGKSPGSFLIEDFRFASVPLAAFLNMPEPDPPATAPQMLLVGDINYDVPDRQESQGEASPIDHEPSEAALLALRGSDSERWNSLDGFRTELEAVRNAYRRSFVQDGTVQKLTGSGATELALLDRMKNHQIVHIVTHGFFAKPDIRTVGQTNAADDRSAETSPGTESFVQTYLPGMLSGLVLAGANRGISAGHSSDDGILRATEIEASSLQGVDLVVMSACETGLGEVAGGEGLTGLQRAFHVAGARSVIASLWKVDDAATTELMKLFYANLWEKNMSKLDALREAQLTMLNHYDAASGQLRGLGGNTVRVDPNKPTPKPAETKRLDPRYWAAFQLSGDWR